jgi:hypothetical protein
MALAAACPFQETNSSCRPRASLLFNTAAGSGHALPCLIGGKEPASSGSSELIKEAYMKDVMDFSSYWQLQLVRDTPPTLSMILNGP